MVLYLRGDGVTQLLHGGYQTLQHPDLIQVALFAVVEEPRAFLCCRHVRELGDTVVIVEVSEGIAVASVGRQCLLLELLEVDEFRLVDDDAVEAL